MTNSIKILSGIFVIIAILIGGFFIYNQLLAPKKPVVPVVPEKPEVLEEKLFPKLIISTPSELEVIAYKASSFNFSIENEKEYPEAKNVNVTLILKEIPILVTPNNINIAGGESQNFEAKLRGLEPGDYELFLKIDGKPEVSIIKTISLKSQITVGLDELHAAQSPTIPSYLWKTYDGKMHFPPHGEYFMNHLKEKNIKINIIESPLTSEILKNINVLIIAKPARPISPDEVQAIKNFLNQGGGVLLAGSHATYMDTSPLLNDVAERLHLLLKFSYYYLSPYTWTKEITDHQITSGIKEIFYQGCVLEVEAPWITLVKQDGRTVYAVQFYAKGKIGAIGSGEMFETRHLEICRSCLELNFNLIKWLATPPTPQELEEMG